MAIVIFGGTAAYHLKLDEHAEVGERRIIQTPFGESAPFVHLRKGGREVWFSSRHGEGGLQRSATFVNHRANIWAARELGVTAILSWNGVGAIAPGMSIGQIIVPDDMLDMTRVRVSTFGEVGRDLGLSLHTPSGKPFDESLRQYLMTACALLNFPCATHGTYVCTEGPRLETAAEISMYGWGGAAVVGMTLAPEVWLAAELSIPYASLCIVTNMATGRWHFDPRRDFGPDVGMKSLQVILSVGYAGDLPLS
jgi:5'-methylthioadenosine phosphorylase